MMITCWWRLKISKVGQLTPRWPSVDPKGCRKLSYLAKALEIIPCILIMVKVMWKHLKKNRNPCQNLWISIFMSCLHLCLILGLSACVLSFSLPCAFYKNCTSDKCSCSYITLFFNTSLLWNCQRQQYSSVCLICCFFLAGFGEQASVRTTTLEWYREMFDQRRYVGTKCQCRTRD